MERLLVAVLVDADIQRMQVRGASLWAERIGASKRNSPSSAATSDTVGQMSALQGDLDQRTADLPGEETMSAPSETDTDAEDAPFFRVECDAGHRADADPRCLHIGT